MGLLADGGLESSTGAAWGLSFGGRGQLGGEGRIGGDGELGGDKG